MEATQKKILATVFLDGREIFKNIYELHNAAELIDASKSQVPTAAELDRFHKYNADFDEFIDSDHNTDIKELDKFHIFFLSGSELADAQTEVICPLAPLPNPQPSQTNSLPDSGLEALKALIKTKAPAILAEYGESGTICTKSRMLLVRIAVSDLVERRGFYPSSDDKVRLAKNVVTLFPKLCVKIQENNEGYPVTSISSLLDGPDASVRAHQPYILCFGHPSEAAQQYVIIAISDKIVVPLGDEGLTCAVDKLFKMNWVCNLEYPNQLQAVFSFLEHIYEMPVSCKKRSKVVELISKLQAMS